MLSALRTYCSLLALALFVLAAGLTTAPAAAQKTGQMSKKFDGVGIDSKLGAQVPTDLTFRNADGETVTLGQYLDGDRPVMLNLVWFDCAMICPRMMSGITSTLKGLDWTPGGKYQVLTVSFNPREGPEMARKQKNQYVRDLGKEGAARGWHFLTGTEPSIKALTDAVGFNYRWVPEAEQYAHPTASIFLSGDGKVTRYIYGMALPSSDARTALLEASNGKVGNPVDKIALYCLQFDPKANTYTADAFNIMKLGSALTVVILGAVLVLFWRRERDELEATDDEMDDALDDIDLEERALGAS
jgi:protein SCO1/2